MRKNVSSKFIKIKDYDQNNKNSMAQKDSQYNTNRSASGISAYLSNTSPFSQKMSFYGAFENQSKDLKMNK